jgi:xanthine/CO dehydrogenase XdhC/CoxF family maturation factor
MTDLERILTLWRELEEAGAEYVLATIIAVEGPSYRKPGACMLLAQDGRRAGTVSGGCLEAEVAQRAWWHTADGPSIQRFSTVEDDGDRPYGSGCGGVVWLLLERRPTAAPLLHAMEQAFQQRVAIAVATVLEGGQLGRRAIAGLDRAQVDAGVEPLRRLAEETLAGKNPAECRLTVEGSEVRIWTDLRPARPGLWIFGAGDDARPLLQLAKALGWYVAIADGRSQLATRERFAAADEVHLVPTGEVRASQSAERLPVFASLRLQDALVVMTHSFEQDAHALASLLALDAQPAYIGVLGPQRRTRELLADAARLLDSPKSSGLSIDDTVERWLAQLHAPTGLDLGVESPETVALSIVAEIQKSLTKATGQPLRTVRAVPAISRSTSLKPN